ncbi:MAG: hypothetical protein KC731_11605 [Myxococcales bacterium]|nr:hypothetical protein [Myxococcales bacterium]
MARELQPLFSDTSLAAERVLLERLRALGAKGRLARVAELRDATIGVATLRLRKEHPTWSEHRIRVELAKTWLEPELHRRVYGDTEP